MQRIPPSEQIRKQLDELLENGLAGQENPIGTLWCNWVRSWSCRRCWNGKRQSNWAVGITSIASQGSRCAVTEMATRQAACAQPKARLEYKFLYQEKHPAAIRSFNDDLEACLVYLRCPLAHHKSIRTTNLLERAFQESRSRTKVIPHFFTEKACLKLVFSALWKTSQR